MADDDTSAAAADASSALDLTAQFMTSLTETMKRLAVMYADCPRTQAHVAEFLRHVDEPRTRQRSVKMWHRAMQPHYVAIAQTKDPARLDRAMRAGMEANWFFAQMEMVAKWADPSFEPSRERFVHAVRVLNGVAFMEHSFLGKLSDALKSITTKLAARGGGMESLDPEAMMELLPELLSLVNQDTLQEINRMLPHVVYVVGGKERLMGMLDQAVGESGPMKGMISELLGAFMPAAGGEEEGGGGGGGSDDGAAAGGAAGAATPSELMDRGMATVRDIFEKIADPDNENSMTEVLESFGLGAGGAKAGGGGAEGAEEGSSSSSSAPPGLALDADSIRSAFEGLMEQFGEGSGAMGAIGSVISQHLGGEGGGAGMDAEELTSLAAEALRVQGIEVDEGQLAAVRRLTSTFGGMAAGAAAEAGPTSEPTHDDPLATLLG